MVLDNEKQCENQCPKCGAKIYNVIWDSIEIKNDTIYQDGVCKKCGCKFREFYIYSITMY